MNDNRTHRYSVFDCLPFFVCPRVSVEHILSESESFINGVALLASALTFTCKYKLQENEINMFRSYIVLILCFVLLISTDCLLLIYDYFNV